MYGDRVMVFNTTFNNISVISWCSILLVEETGEPEENHALVTSHFDLKGTLSVMSSSFVTFSVCMDDFYG